MPVFDDGVRGTHPEDYLLLRNGHLHLYRHQWALARVLRDLTTAGYTAITADLARCGGADDIRQAVIGAVPDWPPGYGQGTWAGFRDGLSDHLLHRDRQDVVLVLAGFSRVHAVDRGSALTLLEVLADIARWHLLFGRRLICLVQTEDPDIELPESRGSTAWNRHEWLVPHRQGTRLPPWIARDATAHQTTPAAEPAHRETQPPSSP